MNRKWSEMNRKRSETNRKRSEEPENMLFNTIL